MSILISPTALSENLSRGEVNRAMDITKRICQNKILKNKNVQK